MCAYFSKTEDETSEAMKQAVKDSINGKKSDFERMKAIARTYATKRECSVQEVVYLVMPELWLQKTFPKVLFLNSNIPEKRYRIFQNKEEIHELPEDSTDIFQRNMLDRYIDRPDKNFMAGRYSAIDAMCFAEFLSYYYIAPKSVKDKESGCQPVVLDDELMESNHVNYTYPKVIPLMSSKEKLKCRNVKAVFRYHQPSPNRDIEKFAHHVLLSFYPFTTEEYLKLPPITGTYFKKASRTRSFGCNQQKWGYVYEALLNLQSNLDGFPQQDENQEEITLRVHDLLDNENPSDGAVLLDDTLFIGSYSTPILIPDDELNCKMMSLNYEQRKLFDIVQGWEKRCVKSKSFSQLTVVEPLYIFLTDDAGCGKSFLMKVIYQFLTKIFSYGNVSLDKPKFLLMAPTGVAAIDIDGATIHTALNIPVGYFGKNLPSLSDKMRSTLRNRLADLKVIIIDEISILSNNFLYYIHLRLNEIFGTTKIEPFAGVTILAVGDFFQLPPVGGSPVYAEYKNTWQNLNSLWKLFKIFELTEVMHQRGGSQLIDLLSNVRTANLNLHNINMIQSRIMQPEDANYPKDALHIYAENATANSYNQVMFE